MTAGDRPTLRDLFRAAPVSTLLVTALPAGLAIAQLANSVVNELPVFVSVPFAVGVLGYGWACARHDRSRLRRKRLERSVDGTDPGAPATPAE